MPDDRRHAAFVVLVGAEHIEKAQAGDFGIPAFADGLGVRQPFGERIRVHRQQGRRHRVVIRKAQRAVAVDAGAGRIHKAGVVRHCPLRQCPGIADIADVQLVHVGKRRVRDGADVQNAVNPVHRLSYSPAVNSCANVSGATMSRNRLPRRFFHFGPSPKSSTTRMSSRPRAFSAATSALPINPAPPVTTSIVSVLRRLLYLIEVCPMTAKRPGFLPGNRAFCLSCLCLTAFSWRLARRVSRRS